MSKSCLSKFKAMVNPSVSGRVKSYQCNSVGVCRQSLDKNR